MSTPNIQLDEFARVISPSFTVPQSRVFVLEHAVAVYAPVNGRSVLVHSAAITSFTRSRVPRSKPHLVVTTSGETWEIYKEGCGCGSPIKKTNWRQAVEDTAQFTPVPVAADTG